MDIQKYVLKELASKGADDVIVYLSSLNNLLIKFSNNKINTTKTWNTTNLNIFVSIDKKLISTSVKDLSMKSVKDAINLLIKFAKSTKENKLYNGIAKGPFKYREINESYDKNILKLDEKAIKFVEQGINTAIENGAIRTAGIFLASYGNLDLLSSNNVNAKENATSLYFSIRAFSDKKASGHMINLSRILNKFNPRSAAKTAAEIAVLAKNPKPGKRGKFDVIFSPMAFSNLLEHVGSASSVFSVESGLSFLANKLNKKVASKSVSLYDDGRLRNGYGSIKFDAEGVPTQKTFIIKDGILKTYLHNTSSAKRYNVKTTANAGLISPSPHNLILEAGDHSKNGLFNEVKKGIYITNVWYTRFNNLATGDFSTIPRDGIFYIENGNIKYPIRDIRVSDNLLRILNNIAIISRDTVQVEGWDMDNPVMTPHVLVKEVNITKSVG